VDVVVHAAPDLWVDVDRARCGQALANLVDNALRHTPPGGRVTMSARADGGKLGGKLRSTSGRADRDGGAARSGGVVVIEVADSGDGIAPEHLPHVFERFYRVDTARDRAHGGFGIGLAIAKALTVAHGGTLTAASGGAGRGAVFTLTLPAQSVPN
jgi:signal transduction histidine kinase